MNTRLFWNFETTGAAFGFPPNSDLPKGSLRWEMRWFWPHDRPILLYGLDASFLELTQFKTKHRTDTYYLLDDLPANLKRRNHRLVYKPLLARDGNLYGYGKKINLHEVAPDTPLPGLVHLSAGDLVHRRETAHPRLLITKTALIREFSIPQGCLMEFTRITHNGGVYFSFSIESRSKTVIMALADHLQPDGLCCDYPTFLRQAWPS